MTTATDDVHTEFYVNRLNLNFQKLFRQPNEAC